MTPAFVTDSGVQTTENVLVEECGQEEAVCVGGGVVCSRES